MEGWDLRTRELELKLCKEEMMSLEFLGSGPYLAIFLKAVTRGSYANASPTKAVQGGALSLESTKTLRVGLNTY